MMASTSPTRRPLGRLDSNVLPPTSSGSWNLLQQDTGASKSESGSKILLRHTYRGEETGKAALQVNMAIKSQRHYDLASDGHTAKKRKTHCRSEGVPEYAMRSMEAAKRDAETSRHKETYAEEATLPEFEVSVGRHMQGSDALAKDVTPSQDAEKNYEREEADSLLSHLVSPSPESATSPTSSEIVAINDSQNTTITVPDDDFLADWPANSLSAMARRPLSQEDIRRKAKEIRLRLSLANYKVRTNQIDIPISRLQVRPSAFSNSFPRRIPGTKTLRTPLPSASIPSIHLQNPSAEKTKPSTLNIPSSPPPPHLSRPVGDTMSPVKHQNDYTRDGLSTPLLPRQRDRLLNPPSLGSPTWDRSEITSSVVKGRAADGLLSLMRQG
ncbi:uncharacterized protein PAC_04213 [Phialocephala subalpina]|uniref:Uncharacterized protein n=1 Tax=Phialocephala subalpina TaxID=576137 RepID=A0A1L7WNH8_9HELO|nr:uncharacterized protein PAC_04213 [Phialocephala subalpina]